MDCEVTAADLCRNKEINRNELSERTFQRFLNDQDYQARRMIKTNFISEKNKEARVEFAEELEDWDLNDYKKVYFSDESYLCC